MIFKIASIPTQAILWFLWIVRNGIKKAYIFGKNMNLWKTCQKTHSFNKITNLIVKYVNNKLCRLISCLNSVFLEDRKTLFWLIPHILIREQTSKKINIAYIIKIKNGLANRSQDEKVDKQSLLSLWIPIVSSWFCYTHSSMTLKKLAGDPKIRCNQLNTHAHHESIARKLNLILGCINEYTCENRLNFKVWVKLNLGKIFNIYKNSATEEMVFKCRHFCYAF